MVKGFLQYLQYEKNYSSHTVLSYRTDIYQLFTFLNTNPEKFNPEHVSSDDIQKWIYTLNHEGLTARTITRKISSTKTFWRYLMKYHQVQSNPTLKIILPKTKKPIPTFFKHKELDAIINNPFLPREDFVRLRDVTIIEMFYMTGIRLSELIALTDKDIDLISGQIQVIGKRNKQRIIPIDKTFAHKLKHYKTIRENHIEKSTNHFFVREDGKKMYPKLIYNIVNQIMKEVSTLKKISPHILRHSFATNMLNNGADINAIKELLGHSSLIATQVYTHTAFSELQKIYKQAHPRAR